MSVDTTEVTPEIAEAREVFHNILSTMPEPAAHEFVAFLMDVEAAFREDGEDFEVQHKETDVDTLLATAEAHEGIVAEALREVMLQALLMEALGLNV